METVAALPLRVSGLVFAFLSLNTTEGRDFDGTAELRNFGGSREGNGDISGASDLRFPLHFQNSASNTQK